MKIEQIEIKNFKAFKHAVMKDIPNLCVVVGANGTGKSTLFDVFGFLKDAMTDNVTSALNKRGGFVQVVSRNIDKPIELEIKFREDKDKPLVTYHLIISLEAGKPVVEREILKYRRGSKGKPWHFLDFSRGRGSSITTELEYLEDETKELERQDQKLSRPDILAIKGLSQFEQFPVAVKFGKLIENWHISDFHITSARTIQDDAYAEHLSREGENLSLVTKYLYDQHHFVFLSILDKLKSRVPGITSVSAKTTEEGRVLLKFQDGSFKDPFLARYVSDGTIKMFAYLVLLYDPAPHPLLCIEEPENQLYPKLLVELAEEFRLYANKGGQVFVSTHSPDFLNAMKIEEVFWLEKKNGYTGIKRAFDNEQLKIYMENGDQMGYLWTQGFFEEVDTI